MVLSLAGAFYLSKMATSDWQSWQFFTGTGGKVRAESTDVIK